MLWASIICGSLSAIFWFASAISTPDLSESYWGGGPAWYRNRVQKGSYFNAAGALFAAIAMGLQAIANFQAT